MYVGGIAESCCGSVQHAPLPCPLLFFSGAVTGNAVSPLGADKKFWKGNASKKNLMMNINYSEQDMVGV